MTMVVNVVEVVALEEATEVEVHTDPQEVVVHVVTNIQEMEVVDQVVAEATVVVLQTTVVAVVTATMDTVNKMVEVVAEIGKEVGV